MLTHSLCVSAYHLDFKLQAVQFFQASCPSQASRDFPRIPHSHPCRNCSIMQPHSQHCYSRSTRRQLWKATQLSRMGFLVTLQHQGHRFLCSQGCLRVGGSEYTLTHIILKSNVNVRIAQGPQTCPRTAAKCLTNVKSARSQEMRLKDDPGETVIRV